MDGKISKPLDIALQMYYQEISKGTIIGSTPTSAPRIQKLTSEICNNWMKFLEVHRGKNTLTKCGAVERDEDSKFLGGREDEVSINFVVQVEKDGCEKTYIRYSIHLKEIQGIWHFNTLHWGISQPILY